MFDWIGKLIKPVGDVIDNLTTTEEEKGKLKNELAKMEYEYMAKIMDYEKQKLQAQADIIKAEAQGGSWIQKSWRPLTMLGFLIIVIVDSFGWVQLDATRVESVYDLLKIGIGGYIVGRSAEKIVPNIGKFKKAVE